MACQQHEINDGREECAWCELMAARFTLAAVAGFLRVAIETPGPCSCVGETGYLCIVCRIRRDAAFYLKLCERLGTEAEDEEAVEASP